MQVASTESDRQTHRANWLLTLQAESDWRKHINRDLSFEDARENYCKGGSTTIVLIFTGDFGIYGRCVLIRLYNGIFGASLHNWRQCGFQLCAFEHFLPK
jgi:hypothetical protein